MARLAALAVALVAWIGLAVQCAATLGQGYDLAATIWTIARYFTILTVVIVAVVFTILALGRTIRPLLLGGTVLSILLVGIIYNTVLTGMVELSGGALLADTLNHKVTPILVPLWWLAFAPKGHSRWRDPLVWALYPLAYFPYALARGQADGNYAYPFLNLDKIGVGGVALNALVIALGFLIAGIAFVALDRRLGHRAPR